MKKRVLSALLVLCMACSMVSTVWATEVTSSVTSGAGTPASQTVGSTATGTGDESGADSTGAPSDSTDSTSASSDSTSSGSSSAASDTASDAASDATSGEGDESAASSDSTAASDSTSSSSSASSDSADGEGTSAPSDSEEASQPDGTTGEGETGEGQENATVTETTDETKTGKDNSTEEATISLLQIESDLDSVAVTHNGRNFDRVYVMDTEGNRIEASANQVNISDTGTGIEGIASALGVSSKYKFVKAVVKSNKSGALEDADDPNKSNISSFGYDAGYNGKGWAYKTPNIINESAWKSISDQNVYFIFEKLPQPETIDTADTEEIIGINLFNYDKSVVKDGSSNVLGNFDFGASGDRDENQPWNSYSSGNGDGAYQGIMKKLLEGNYPAFNTDLKESGYYGESLGEGAKAGASWLFSDAGPMAGKTVYTGLNHLFTYNEAEHKYSYDSASNFASIVAEDPDKENTGTDKNFVVYENDANNSGGNSVKFAPFNTLDGNNNLVGSAD